MYIRRSFTLVELLSVIGIVALLAAILFPVFNAAREKGRRSTCTSQMRQISIALKLYQQDHDSQAPFFGNEIHLKAGYDPLGAYVKTNRLYQ